MNCDLKNDFFVDQFWRVPVFTSVASCKLRQAASSTALFTSIFRGFLMPLLFMEPRDLGESCTLRTGRARRPKSQI